MTHGNITKQIQELLNKVGKMHSDVNALGDEHIEESKRLFDIYNALQELLGNFAYTTQLLLKHLKLIENVSVCLATCPAARGIVENYAEVLIDLMERMQKDITQDFQKQDEKEGELR